METAKVPVLQFPLISCMLTEPAETSPGRFLSQDTDTTWRDRPRSSGRWGTTSRASQLGNLNQNIYNFNVE